MRLLIIEPYWGGSHRAFIETLIGAGVDEPRLDCTHCEVLSLPANHWKWRMREAALYFAEQKSKRLCANHDLLLASAYLPLAELFGLVPGLARTPSILFFHENQFTYPTVPTAPVEKIYGNKKRDLHFGFTQAVSAAAATHCVFNSRYNQESFLHALSDLLQRMPTPKPKNIVRAIRQKSTVLPLPLDLEKRAVKPAFDPGSHPSGPILLFNHRWEHDKDPQTFFKTLYALKKKHLPFRLIVCGGHPTPQTASLFKQASEKLADRILHWGYCSDRNQYHSLLASAHVAISTARHEFFGIAMLEATAWGAYPLVPDRLVYPEIFPEKHRYRDRAALIERLTRLCGDWTQGKITLRKDRRAIVAPFDAKRVILRYRALFEKLIGKSSQSSNWPFDTNT
jgi:glycosyltransferase involved in cell wall biosynthesis